MSDPDHIRLMEAVARHFFGEPNARLSKKRHLRFGTNGSKSVDLEKGVYYDHENREGGDAIELIMRELDISDRRQAYCWAETQGYWVNGSLTNGSAKGNGGREVDAYDYTDEAGVLLSQVVWLEPKDFRQRRPDGRGGWEWNVKSVRAVPYNLPRLLEAIGNEQTLYIAEGEKDCDRLGKLGLVASTNAGGAGNWRGELTPCFRNADAIVIADNDPQSRDKSGKPLFYKDGRPKFAGQDHAAEVVAQLVTVARRVRLLDLGKVWLECPPKGDISDWFDAGHSVEELNAIVEQLPDWQSQRSESSSTRDNSAHGFSWTLLRHGDSETRVPRKWVIDGLLPQTGVGLLSGQWGTFKTFNAFDLSGAVMTNGQFIHFPVKRPGGVFLLANEGQSEIDTRISAAWSAHGGSGQAPFIWVPKTPRLLDDRATEILVAMIRHAQATLEREAGVPLSLVLIDALGKAAGFNKPGDENDAAVVKRVMRVLSDASLETGVLVLGLTHFGKQVDTGTRGSSSFEDDADVVLALIGQRAVGGTIGNTRLCVRKSRSSQAGDEFPFRTRGVVVGSENTLVIDWSVAEPPERVRSKADGWEKKSLRLLRQALMNTLVEAGKELKPWPDGPIVRAVDIEVVRPQFYKGYPAAEATDANAKKAARQKAFKRAVNESKASNLIGCWEIEGVTYIWLVVPAQPSS